MMHRIFSKSLLLSECILNIEHFRQSLAAFRASLLTDRRAWRTNRTLLVLVGLALIVCASVFVGIGAKNALLPSGSHDLQWTPSRDLVAGVNPYENFLRWKSEGNELTPPHFLNQSPGYPASVYVLLSPIAPLDWPVAKLTWLVLNLSMIALIIAGLQRTFPIQSPVLLFLVVTLFLCSTPLRASLGAGQINLLSIAAFLWSYHYAQQPGANNARLSGLLLAIAWVKYSLTFPLSLIFINQKNWRPLLIAIGIHSVLTVIAALQLNLWPQQFFFSSVEVVLMGSGTGFLNLSALAMKLHLPIAFAMFAIVTVMIAVGVQISRLPNADPLPLLASMGLFSYAVFYHHPYDFIVLILLAWCIARKQLGAPAVIASTSLIVLSWGGLWLVNEIQPALGVAGNVLVSITEVLMIAAFYSTLFLLAKHFVRRRTAKLSDRVLAF
jgi:hypothetical protein